MRKFFAFASFCLMCVVAGGVRSGAQDTAKPMGSHPIQPTDWSFQCENGDSCGIYGTWITTISQPGTVRLWDSSTNWAMLETAKGSYDWTYMDLWLDRIAEHQPRAAIYTFGHVPCWIASCTIGGNDWSTSPPRDLTVNGSPSFTAFVTALVGHCSSAGNCVKDYIKYWEMWNEPNLTDYWTGTPTQLYYMFKPVIPIIRAHVPGAITSTPPVSGGDKTWMTSWMTLENKNGRISDYYGFHSYLYGYTPEHRMNMIQSMVSAKNANGWTTTPWMNTETNFEVTTDVCSSQYTTQDCDGQLVRWHVLQFAYQGGAGGAFHVGWYNWDSITKGGYDTFYYTMMQWLVGSTFTASCSSNSNGNVWTCPLTESNGHSALIVWDPSGNSVYTPASQYVDYKEFNGTYGGATKTISPGQATTIGVIPIMFEAN